MRCPRCSGKLIEDRPTCPGCGWVRAVRHTQAKAPSITASWLQPDEAAPINTSGTGLPPPPEVRDLGYCWGGFALPFYFSWTNNIALGCLLNGLVIQIWLGRHGHEAAWKNRRFRDFTQFRETMAAWDRWGKTIMALNIVIFLLVLLFAVGAFVTSGGGNGS